MDLVELIFILDEINLLINHDRTKTKRIRLFDPF